MALSFCFVLRTSYQWFAKELVIIQIIKHKNPLSDLSILQPVPEELEYISVAVPAPGNLGAFGNIAETFLAAGRITRMNPENPGVRRLLSDTVTVFDGKLSFPVEGLALN